MHVCPCAALFWHPCSNLFHSISPFSHQSNKFWLIEVFNKPVKWHKPSFCIYSYNSDSYCCFFFSFSDLSLPGYRWGANWCCGMQLCWLLNCQGAKSKGVSFVNYTQCYKQSCSFEPFLSSTIHKYFGSGTKRKGKKTIYTQLSQWDEQTACRCLFGLYWEQRQGFPNLDKMRFLKSLQSSKHAVRCIAHRSPALERISEALKTLAL